MHQSIGHIMGIKPKGMQLLELLFFHVAKAIQCTNHGHKNKGNVAARVIVLTCSLDHSMQKSNLQMLEQYV